MLQYRRVLLHLTMQSRSVRRLPIRLGRRFLSLLSPTCFFLVKRLVYVTEWNIFDESFLSNSRKGDNDLVV